MLKNEFQVVYLENGCISPLKVVKFGIDYLQIRFKFNIVIQKHNYLLTKYQIMK